jgi:hypothetical protein
MPQGPVLRRPPRQTRIVRFDVRRAGLGSIIVSALPVAALLTHQRVRGGGGAAASAEAEAEEERDEEEGVGVGVSASGRRLSAPAVAMRGVIASVFSFARSTPSEPTHAAGGKALQGARGHRAEACVRHMDTSGLCTTHGCIRLCVRHIDTSVLAAVRLRVLPGTGCARSHQGALS